MKISVVGTGYVGLVTGTCFAETGHDVVCVDIDADKVQKMVAGQIPIYEPHLEGLFQRNIKEGRLNFTTNLKDGIEDARVIFLALPTPPGEDGSADLSYILSAAEEIGKILDKYTIIIDKSTVPVGTAEKVTKKIKQNAKVGFDVVSNPEFLREGFAVDDFMKPDRVVIGTSSQKAIKVLKELYRPFVRQGNPIYFMDERSAEMTKYAANSFLATKISFMNEIALLCEKTGVDVDQVRLGIGSDERIGKRFLFPGIGYGGSCFPKDVKALIHTAGENGCTVDILDAVTRVNDRQKKVLVNKVIEYFGGNIKGKKFALWGLAFKPDTDDVREAPSLTIIAELIRLGASVVASDLEAMNNVKASIKDKALTFEKDHYKACAGADALIIATEWALFRSPDFKVLKGILKDAVIFDGRNLYEPKEMYRRGFYYSSIGRAIVDGRQQ